MYHDEFIQDYEQKYGEKYWQEKPIPEDRLKMIADSVERYKNDDYPEVECFDVDIYEV
jgi:hypothetical protein